MNYPVLPLAIVNLLAGQNTARNENADKRMVMICRHDGESVNYQTLELPKDPVTGNFQWDQTFAGLAHLQSAGRSDTLMIIYPSELDGAPREQRMDVAVLVRPHEEPQVFQWHWAPHFQLYHVGKDIDFWAKVTQGAGVEMMQNMLDKEHPKPASKDIGANLIDLSDARRLPN